MKITGLILLVITSFNGFLFSQTAPKFKLTKDGMKPVVITFDTSYREQVIYTKIKEWIKTNNKNPNSVVRIDNPNSLIKFSSYKDKAWKLITNGAEIWNEMQYTFSVEIKKGKCRVTFGTEETRYKVWYNKDGTLIKKFKPSEASFENTVNETLASMYNYLKGSKKKVSDDW
jgi:hypothetical protein